MNKHYKIRLQYTNFCYYIDQYIAMPILIEPIAV